MLEAAVRVLLVDDDEDEYVIVGDLLRVACSDGFHLTWAPTYDEGLRAIHSSTCDVCLVDYRLGQRSGLDLMAEVATGSNPPQFILLTGEGDRALDLNATKAGAADYLIKGELTAALLERSVRYAYERGRTLKELRDAQTLAQSLNHAKSAFVASMSHEIRTPMNAILGISDMLWESKLDTEQRRYVEVLRRAGSGLLSLINDILDLSKIESGHLELERVEFDLEEVMDQAIEVTAVKARIKNIALLSHLYPGVATSLMGDPTRLRQILINLLGNAVKFTDSGEVVLSARNQEIGKPGQIELAVTDTGIGIPDDKLETIFEDFTQGDASTTRKYGGTGLGLGISRRLVEAMGGSLTATSVVDQGTKFQFTVQFDPAEIDFRKADVTDASFQGKRILLIGTNATSRQILAETFWGWGMDTDCYGLAATALARLPAAMTGERPYSLAVIDVCPAARDGFETAAAIKRIASSLPIVMLASHARPEDSRRAEAALAGFSVKPLGRTHLARLIGEALVHRKSPQPSLAASIEHKGRGTVKPAKILIAEDSEDNRVLVEAYLKASPYQLTFEEDGKAALDRFANSDFDLILMDVQMPVMDGLAATRAIRALERERGSISTPIIALTADANLKDIEISGDAGCNFHLSKPASKFELLSAIEKYRRQLSPELTT